MTKEHIPPSIQSPLQFELKSLSSTLKYVFLGPEDTFPVIIIAGLTLGQQNQLIDVLKQHKGTIGWSVADLKEINLSICMHRIYDEDNTKPSREMQRRLNPNIRELVKKGKVKWLDAGIIYLISDSQ